MTNKINHPLMRYHGAKFRLADWIMSFFPPHNTYVEPFGGAAGVLLQKPRSMSEVYNDMDDQIVNVFRVLQDKKLAAELIEKLMVTPYSRAEFELAYKPTDDIVDCARRTLIRAGMGFGSAGSTKNKTGFRIDSARKYGTSAQLWSRYPLQISAFIERLQGVIIENRPAITVIDNHDGDDTCFFVDPPYMHSTRKMGHSACYNHEMSDSDHELLLQKLLSCDGYIVLSGYDTELYNDVLSNWNKFHKKARISAGKGTGVRSEYVWLNPRCNEKQLQISLIN